MPVVKIILAAKLILIRIKKTNITIAIKEARQAYRYWLFVKLETDKADGGNSL